MIQEEKPNKSCNDRNAPHHSNILGADWNMLDIRVYCSCTSKFNMLWTTNGKLSSQFIVFEGKNWSILLFLINFEAYKAYMNMFKLTAAQ